MSGGVPLILGLWLTFAGAAILILALTPPPEG